MASIALDGLRKEYENGFVAVHDASFDVEDGEFVVLVGPSGCGKSTTLRMVAGLESITEGTLHIGDRVVNEMAPKDRDVAMVFQNYALYPHMTVFDNMAFGLKLRKFPKAEIRQRVEHAGEILGITEILDRKPKQLSGGQRQRVAVGRAIVRKPQVFLFDEPLSNLDAKLRVQMRTEISKLHRKLGATMLYVTHDQVEAMTMGDRIVVLKDGYIQQIDTPLNLYNHPENKFVAGFIGSPSMNFINGRIEKESGLIFRAKEGALVLPVSDLQTSFLSPYKGKSVTMGVRPEDLYLKEEISIPEKTAFVDATIDVLEPMGNEIVLYVSASELALVARIAPQANLKVGQTITLGLDLNKLHFFDGENGNAIRSEQTVSDA